MKYVNLLMLVLFISSCCATKQVTEKPEKNIAQLEETAPIEDHSEIPQTILEDKQEELKNIPVEDEKETNTVKQNDSVYFIKVVNHDIFNDLLKKHVSKNGNVDYKGFSSDSKLLRNYITHLGENMPKDGWLKGHKLAYWINAYNAMTIDLIVRNYPIQSIKDIKDPWEQRLWKLGNKWYNLNEIEHHILRKMNEPRIHFGIVCASISCPKLQNEAFTALNLDELLTKATKEFLADKKRNNITSDEIKISQIFKWFSKDFKKNGSLIDFLNQYSAVPISTKAKKSFKDYNWDLNE